MRKPINSVLQNPNANQNVTLIQRYYQRHTLPLTNPHASRETKKVCVCVHQKTQGASERVWLHVQRGAREARTHPGRGACTVLHTTHIVFTPSVCAVAAPAHLQFRRSPPPSRQERPPLFLLNTCCVLRQPPLDPGPPSPALLYLSSPPTPLPRSGAPPFGAHTPPHLPRHSRREPHTGSFFVTPSHLHHAALPAQGAYTRIAGRCSRHPLPARLPRAHALPLPLPCRPRSPSG